MIRLREIRIKKGLPRNNWQRKYLCPQNVYLCGRMENGTPTL